MASDGYGQQLAERLRAEEAHAIVTRVLRTADMAVTETRCDDPVLGLSHSIQREDAYLVALTLRDFPNRQYWENGRQMPMCDLRTGQVDFHDLKRNPVALLDKPYHDLFFYLPRCALDAIADDADVPRIGDLNHEPSLSTTASFPVLGWRCYRRSAIPTRRANCSSTTSSWRSGYMLLRPMEVCELCHGRSAAGSRRGRRGAPRKFSAPTSMAVCRSRRWLESADCR
jgi:hypothetical protein